MVFEQIFNVIASAFGAVIFMIFLIFVGGDFSGYKIYIVPIIIFLSLLIYANEKNINNLFKKDKKGN